MSHPLTHFCPAAASSCLLSTAVRGSQATPRLTFSSMMQTHSHLAFIFLCSLSFFSSVLSKLCSDKQYAWPVASPSLCCDKCSPGTHMIQRTKNSCGIKCGPCEGDRYTDSYNVGMSCNSCEICDKPNMEYKLRCNASYNAVCRCAAGYRCKDQRCTQCLPVIVPITSPPPTSTTALKAVTITTTTAGSTKPVTDSTCFLVIIVLLCVGIVLIVLTKMRTFQRWTRSKHGYFLAEKPAPVPPCTQDEGVSKPVQEMCGKCDQPIDV